MRLLSILSIFLFCILPHSAAAQLRPMVYSEVSVDRSASEAFADWTTEESVESFFAEKAFIDPVPGGDYALWFAIDAPEGSRGSDSSTVLAVESDKMLSFTWAMPPYMPEIRPHLTVVQILFVPVGEDRTRVRLFHTGFGSGEAWEKGHDYFEQTWPAVLSGYKEWAEAQ